MSGVGETYKGAALRAILDLPGTLFGAWLDGSGAVLAYTGIAVPADAFEAIDDTCVNTSEVDGGAAPADAASIVEFALVDAPEGDVLIAGPVTFDETPTEGDPLVAAPGALVLYWDE